jgi:hypothetical protein
MGQVLSQGLVGQDILQCLRQSREIVRRDQQAGIADVLGHGRNCGGNNWRSTGHGLQGWKPEALVNGRIDKYIG